MDLLTLQEFHQLVQHQSRPSLSIYLPGVKAGREIQQNPVRLKNLLSEAESRLEEIGISHTEREELLEPARKLIPDREFWQNQEKGLAVFLSDERFEVFRLPLEFGEQVVVDRRFHIKPLLPLFVENERFYLLALSRKDLRLFVGTRYDLAEMKLPETPTSLEEAMRFDDPERELQYQSGATGSVGEGTIFHGHHPENDQEANLKRFFQLVDKGLMTAIGEGSEPLVLAGLEYLNPIFREVNSYHRLLEKGVTGNPDQMDLEELHSKAWGVVRERNAESRSQELDRYYGLSNGRTTESLEKIISASYHARVDSLFIDLERAAWGQYDPDQDSLELSSRDDPHSRDLIDLAVIHTLLNGGTIQMFPEKEFEELSSTGMAAILRY